MARHRRRKARSSRRQTGTLFFALVLLGSTTPLAGQIFVGNTGDKTIRVYAADAANDAAPLRTFGGPAQFYVRNESPAVYLAGEELFVAGGLDSNVGVYDLSAPGDQLATIRTIEGPNTGLALVTSVAVDPTHRELLAASSSSDSIVVFRLDASGNATPLRTIAGVQADLTFPTCVFLDLEHDEIFAVSRNPMGVRVYPRTGNGAVAPLRTIAGSSTGLYSARQLFADLEHDEIFVTQYDDANILVFPRTGDGNIAPLRTIGGPATGIGHAYGIVLTSDGELLVADDTDDSILVFKRTDNGEVPPQRTIVGTATLLDGPLGIASLQAVQEGWGNAVSLPIFVDGFESSDTSAWSNVQP